MITVYSSIVYIGIARGIALLKEISVFTFSFNLICLLVTSRWKTHKKVTACKKIR